MLDRTEQRILGVLIEKELSVPETYPLTSNALLAGCNQKSNRDPEMSLEDFELTGALLAMKFSGWVTGTEGGRATRYRHEVKSKLALSHAEKAVLAELLVRGPQACGALKARVARMGFAAASPEEVEDVLERLRGRPGKPLVEKQARRPREREERWAHCLGPQDAASGAPAAPTAAEARPSAPAPEEPPLIERSDLEARVAGLEAEVAALRAELHRLAGKLGGEASEA